MRCPASLLELKTSEEEEGEAANVVTCRLQSPLNRGGKGGIKRKCVDWRPELTRFLSWTRLVWLQARVWRVVYNVRSPKERIKGQELLPEEIEDAEEEIIS